MPDTTELAEGAQPTQQLRVRISSPSSLLAVVPPLLGFEPSEPSLVVVGTEPPRAEVRITLRFDIPDARHAAAVVDDAIIYLATNGITTAAVVGYGPAPWWTRSPGVPPALPRRRDHADGGAPRAGSALLVLRLHEPGVLPARGHAVRHVGAPRRREVRGQARPGVPRGAGADHRAGHRGGGRGHEPGHPPRRGARPPPDPRGREPHRAQGPSPRAARPGPAGRHRGHHPLPRRPEPRLGNAAAWLALVLEDLPVRDDAWARMDPDHNEAHLRLWTDVTRLAQPGYAAAPAALLAFTAWQSGNGALANVALDRALADQPDYSMARLLRQALDSGAPPSMARLPMTPEEVAASYDAMNSDEEDGDAKAAAEWRRRATPTTSR